MKTINSEAMREAFAPTLDAATAEPIEITRTAGSESIVMLAKSRYDALMRSELDADMDFILERHAATFEALADR